MCSGTNAHTRERSRSSAPGLAATTRRHSKATSWVTYAPIQASGRFRAHMRCVKTAVTTHRCSMIAFLGVSQSCCVMLFVECKLLVAFVVGVRLFRDSELVSNEAPADKARG